MIVNSKRLSGRFLFVLLIIIFAVFIVGCRVNNVGLVGDAARAELTQDVSPAINKKLQRLSKMDYAQMIGIFPGRLEVVFLLAKTDENSSRNTWMGGGGISLVTDGALVIKTDGLASGISESNIVRRGSISEYMAGSVDLLTADNYSIQKYQDADSGEWVKLTGQIVENEDIYYSSEVFTGLVKKITEKVSVENSAVKLKRTYWIAPRSRSLLRVEGDLTPELMDVVLIWLRVPSNIANSN